MVLRNNYIVNDRRPTLKCSTKYICDECGAECLPLGLGTRFELLYRYADRDLCYKCMHEAFDDSDEFLIVSE